MYGGHPGVSVAASTLRNRLALCDERRGARRSKRCRSSRARTGWSGRRLARRAATRLLPSRAASRRRAGAGPVAVPRRRTRALVARPLFKPRDQWHTFWNAGDEPARILEIIAPAGFERFFRELSDLGGAIDVDPDELTALGARYGHYFQLDSVPELLERFGLRVGKPLSGGWTPSAN